MAFGEWSDGREDAADIVDALSRLTSMLSDARTTEGAPVVARPSVLRARMDAVERARRARETIANTEWEEV